MQGGTVHPLCNKVYCSNCNQIFTKTGTRRSDGTGYLCCKDKKTNWSNCDNKASIRRSTTSIHIRKMNEMLKKFYEEDDLKEMQNEVIEQDLYKDKLNSLEKELQSINKELQGKSTYFQKLYEDRTNGILPEKEFLILMNKYKDDNEKLEERQKIVKKEISSTLAKRNSKN